MHELIRERQTLIGTSPAMGHLEVEIEAAARSHAQVLVTGETGVGKRVIAHTDSPTEPASNWSLRHDQLRRCAGLVVGVGVLRACQRQLYWCLSRQCRPVETGPRGHHPARRSWRDEHPHAGAPPPFSRNGRNSQTVGGSRSSPAPIEDVRVITATIAICPKPSRRASSGPICSID